MSIGFRFFFPPQIASGVSIKGQCHEIVVEIMNYSPRYRPKLRFANTFFQLKLGRLKATVSRVVQS
jgi:hypothetical protein